MTFQISKTKISKNWKRPKNSRLNQGKPEPGKKRGFQLEPPGKFPVERGKTGIEKNGAFRPEPPGNFPVEPEKPPGFFGSPGVHPWS